MFEYRITKYRPDADPADDWTAISDIGREFAGRVLTQREYLAVENKYLRAFELLARESEVDRLFVRGLEKMGNVPPSWRALEDGSSVSIDEAVELVRSMLREDGGWCRLENDQLFFVHVGFDLYMYVGSHRENDDLVAEVERGGLWVDRDFPSPYHPDPDDD